jgi:AraC-like DNA-binding protein
MDWLARVTNDIQKHLGGTLLGSIEDASHALLRVGDLLPEPRTPTERLLLRGLLLELACRNGESLHALIHVRNPGRCGFSHADHLTEFFAERSSDPRQAFSRWAHTFLAALQQTHPATRASQASSVIRDSYAQTLNVEKLARQVHMTPSQLRRAFRQEFRMSVRDYYARVRLQVALEDVVIHKIEVAALQVGFKRTSDFYRWFKKATGLTPLGFRRLPGDRRRQMIDEERLALNIGQGGKRSWV